MSTLPNDWNAWREAGDALSFAKLIETYGFDDVIDARSYDLAAVIEGSLFQRAMPGSWHQNSIAKGKLAICARICGRDYDPLERQRD